MKQRLDLLVEARGIAPSRTRAQALIMEGLIYVDGERIDKPGASVQDTAAIESRGQDLPYVSRGGQKLAKAFALWPIDVTGCNCLDIGASTGGFTDCLLQHGASHVWAVDSGYGQLAYALRCNPQVTSMERTNFRYARRDDYPVAMDFACCDVSFISLSRMLHPAHEMLRDGADMVALIKPQFEAGRDLVGKRGVVRDPAVHRDVIERVIVYAYEAGFTVRDVSYSPIRGPEGNIEYLLYLSRTDTCEEPFLEWRGQIMRVVEEAHEAL